jgi:hypothetical protein
MKSRVLLKIAVRKPEVIRLGGRAMRPVPSTDATLPMPIYLALDTAPAFVGNHPRNEIIENGGNRP